MDRTVTRFKNGEVIEVFQREVDWDELLHQRDSLLRKSDWRAVKDRVLPEKWRIYRQKLRDITEHPDANTACDHWPEAPSDE